MSQTATKSEESKSYSPPEGFVLRECPRCSIRVVVGAKWKEASVCVLCKHDFNGDQSKKPVKKKKEKQTKS